MRVLLTADPFLPVPPKVYGGIERVVALLLEGLQRRGHEVGLVAHPDSPAPADFFLAWPEIEPASTVSHASNVRALSRAVREFGPNLVHSFSRLAYLAPLLPRRLAKVMSYQRSTGGFRNRIATAVAGRSLAFTGCSEFIAAMGRRHGGQWHAIPNFVDTGFYPFSGAVAPDAPLVFLSRVEAIKGAHLAIESARRSGRRLLIAGNHAETGPDGDYWRERIEPHLGRGGIEYVGPIDDAAKIALLGGAAALLVPIQWDEPFGIVFAEALACGTPVISCPRGALPEIISDGAEGFLVDDVEAACDAVRMLDRIDRRQCRKRAEDWFSIEAVIPRYEALYGAVAGAI